MPSHQSFRNIGMWMKDGPAGPDVPRKQSKEETETMLACPSGSKRGSYRTLVYDAFTQ